MTHVKTFDITGGGPEAASVAILSSGFVGTTAAGSIRAEPDHVVLELNGKKPRKFATVAGAYEVLMRATKAKEAA